MFELPPLSTVKSGGAAMLEGMDRRRDGHAWTETTTTNISDPDGQLSFKYVKCLGHLRCENLSCPGALTWSSVGSTMRCTGRALLRRFLFRARQL